MDATRFHQLVPRPSLVVPGEPPSWLADPSVARAVASPLESLLPRLTRRLGAVAPTAPVISAVLVGLFTLADEPAVLLTRRAATMRSEPLTVSFPGGRIEPDEPPVEAALREATEEVGIEPSSVHVLGALPIVSRRIDAQLVLPVVAHLLPGFIVQPNPAEVDAVLEVPLRALLVEGAVWSERWGSQADAREIRFFAHESDLGADLVWGLTTRILWELLELFRADEV